MFRRFAAAGALAFAVLFAAPVAWADGPMPYASQGGSGVLMPDELTRLVAVGVGAAGLPQSRTELEVIQTQDAAVRNWVDLRGSWGLPVVTYSQSGAEGISPDGKTVVLGDVLRTYPRTTSAFLVLNAKTLQITRTIELKGDFAYDALSPDASTLYLIQHVDATNSQRYVVRAYDLTAGHLLPDRIADRTQQSWVMQGFPLTRATSVDGRWVFTLYQNPGGYPFVHALDTMRGRAHCIGLPWSGDQSIFSTMQLALRDAGRTLALDVRWNAPNRPATLPSFRIDTSTYGITEPHPGGGHFPWWTLGLAAPFVLLAAASTRARVTSTIASRSATAMCSSGVWISAIPFARLTHWRPRSLKTFASAAPPDKP